MLIMNMRIFFLLNIFFASKKKSVQMVMWPYILNDLKGLSPVTFRQNRQQPIQKTKIN